MELGQLVMTCGIANAMEESPGFALEVQKLFNRYLVQDWGDLCREDIQLNIEALRDGNRILAVYKTSRGNVYVITEWDRSVTTILFASEY